MEYEGYYHDEIMLVMGGIERFERGLKFSSSLYDTKNLCRLFLNSTMQRVRGIYGALCTGDWLVFSSAMRTVIEGIVDQYYIALSNDRDINRLFADYYKLSLHWHCRYIEHYRTQIPKIKADYDKYVFEHMATKVTPKTKSKQQSRLTTAKEIDDAIESKYSGSWTGLSFYGRIQAIIVLVIYRSKPDDPERIFDRIRTELQTEDSAKFQSLNHDGQQNAIIDRLCANNGITRDQIDRDINPLIKLGQIFWKVLCKYTHTTPFSVIPHFCSDDGRYQIEWHFRDERLKDAEGQLYLVLTSSAYALAKCLDDSESQQLIDLIETLTKQCPRLCEDHFQ